MNRIIFHHKTVDSLIKHFAQSAPLEEGAFCLLRKGRGIKGTRFLVKELVLPPSNAWERQADAVLRPSAQWISAAISRAIEARSGLLFIHSHPSPHFPTGLSFSDERAFKSLAEVLAPMLDGPFAAVVVHPTGWQGVFWMDGRLVPFDRIMGIGRTLQFLSPPSPLNHSDLDLRQRDALGVVHDRLSNLSVAVVGCGGIGSPLSEQLVRMGINELILVDYDKLDTPSNIRRVFGSTAADLQASVPPPKIDVVGRHLDQLGFDCQIYRIHGDVRTEETFRMLLDTDIVISCTDSHSSRAVINDLASVYLLPVIDVGSRVGSKEVNLLVGLVAEVRILTPTTPCLWCRRSISGDMIRIENLPKDERERLKREGYVMNSFGDPMPSVVALTVLGSGLATCALLALISEEGEVVPNGYWIDGFFGDSGKTDPEKTLNNCWCRTRIGFGDAVATSFIGRPKKL